MPVFPLSRIPALSYKTGKRYFGAPRGARLHAGCDLIATAGTKVYAAAKGTIIQGPYPYLNTGSREEPILCYAIEVRHPDFTAVYGEIDLTLPKGVRRGSTVDQGQVIAYVGAQRKDAMLHFEMYSDPQRTDPIKQPNNQQYLNVAAGNYKRRSDLLDPSDFLDDWSAHLPGATPAKPQASAAPAP